MKRIFAFGLFMTLLIGLGFHAKAEVSVTVTWDTPGTLAPIATIGGMDVSEVQVSKTETSQTFSIDSSWGYLKLWPANGYYFEDATAEDGSTISPSVYVTPPTGSLPYNTINGISINLSTYGDGKTIHLNLAKVKRESLLTVNVANGLSNINTFQFSSGYAPELKKGNNDVYYNAEVDGKLTVQFAGNGPENKPYIFTLNDEEPSEMYNAPFRIENAYSHIYSATLDPEADDNYMYIQVFENNDEEPDTFDLTINYGQGMEGCLSNIYNKTIGKMTTSAEFENGIITGLTDLLDGTELRLNFLSDDYTITKILVNGTDMTSYLENEGDNVQQYFTLTMTQNTTLTVEGRATIWNDIVYTGYVSDPEGVQFGLSMDDYNLSYTEVGDVSGQTYGVLTMPAGSKEIKLTVSEKNNRGNGTFYFKPKSGNFITLCYFGTPNDSQTNGTQTVNAAMGKDDGGSFYMIVEKMEPEYTANINVHVSGYPDVTYIKSANTYSEQNDNPAQKAIMLESGESEISFIPNYDNPFTLSLNQNQTARIYLDGAEVSGASNSDTNQTDYVLDLYAPAAGETSDIHSAIDVYFTGTPTMATARVNLENGAQAEFFYSPVMHPATPEGQSVMVGTLMTVKPASENAVVIYKGAAQTLDENGQFQFTTTSSAIDNVVTVALPKSAKIAGMVPKAGSTVSSLDGVTLLVPAVIDGTEVMMTPVLEKLNQTVITFNNETVAEIKPFADASELEGVQEGNNLLYAIKFNKRITTAGNNYYVKVPEGAFVETGWDETSETFATVPGGYSTAGYSGRFNIDPTLGTPLDTYELSPASGESVGEIAKVVLEFPQLPAGTQFTSYEFPKATFANGSTTVEAIVMPDWNFEGEHVAFNITPINEEEEPTPITEEGEWTLNLEAGAIATEEGSTPEITATYTIVAQTTGYVISPANGAKVEKLSEITITFPDVTEVEYNDEVAITLVGPDEFKATSTDVTGIGNSRTVSFRNPTVEGEYTVTFPAGAFTLDGEASKEAVVSYVFVKKWTISPEPGLTVTSLNELTLSFPDATEVEYVGSGSNFIISDPGQLYASPVMNCMKVEDAHIPTFKITLPEGAQTPPNGPVIFTVEEGTFEIDGEASPEIRVDYTLDAPISTEYTVSPDGTVIIGDFGYFVNFIFDEAAKVTVPAASDVTVTFDGETVPSDKFNMGAEMNVLMIGFFDAEYMKEGTLKVEIAAGAFKIGKEDSPAISEEWTVVANKTFEAEIEAANGETTDNQVGDLSVIYVTFPEATSGEIFNEFGASIHNASYSYQQGGTITLVENDTRAKGVKFAITFNPAPTAEGNYYFSVREGTFLLDSIFNSPEIEKIYMFNSMITGIESLFADENGNVTVFTLDGKVVLNNVPAAQLRELEKGMYIINGKKALVK